MTQLLAWVAVCGAWALVLRRRPVDVVVGALVLWFLLPDYAASRVTGQSEGPLALHPAAWLLLVATAVQAVRAPGTMARMPARHPYATVSVAVFCAVGVVSSVLNGGGGLALLADQVVTPFLAFWLVVVFADGRALLRLRTAILALVALNCLVALAQWRLGRLVPYAADAEALYWFDPLTYSRWFGLTDSPLVLSLAVCAATPLLVGLDRDVLRFGLAGLLLLGCLIAQSRTGSALVVVLVLWSLWRSQASLAVRVSYLGLLAVAGAVLLRTTIAEGVGSRFSVDDGGSTGARVEAVQFFVSHLRDYLFVGEGPTSSYRVADAGGLITSLESSYMMWAVDCGVVVATLYFGTQVVIALAHARGAAATGTALGALVGCLLQHTYSGVATSSLVGTLTWVLLGMTVAVADCRAAAGTEYESTDPPPDAGADTAPALVQEAGRRYSSNVPPQAPATMPRPRR